MATQSPTLPEPTSPAAASRPPSGPLIPLDLITESKTNPRKTQNQQADRELAESVRVHGVLQPVLVRPLLKTLKAVLSGTTTETRYELVVGARRFRAAQAAGQKQIPATIRELSDAQAMELQIVENLQREDVAPIEEGQGYKQLLAALAKQDPKCAPDGQGVKRQELIAEIARKVGKSVRYVYARMKLAELPEEAQKLLESGFLATSHADELVRLQPADQKEALAYLALLRQDFSDRTAKRDEPPSLREFKRWIADSLVIDLSKAPFKLDDAKLLPAAGACTTCPKMVGNNPVAFEGSGLPANRCTDAACFQKKKLALVQVNVDAIAAKKGAAPLLISARYRGDGDAASRKGVLYAESYQAEGYDEKNKRGAIKPDSCARAALAVYVDGDKIGQAVWICRSREYGAGQCPEHRYKGATMGSSASAGDMRKRANLENRYRARLFEQVSAKVLAAPGKVRRDELVLAATYLFDRLPWPAPGRVAVALGWAKKATERLSREQVENRLAKLSEAELRAHLVLFTAGSALASTWGKPTDLLVVAQHHQVNAAQVLAQLKEKSKAKKKPSKKPVQASANRKIALPGMIGKAHGAPRRKGGRR